MSSVYLLFGKGNENPKTIRLLYKVFFLDVLEIPISTYAEFVGSGLVAYDDAMLVHLQGTDGPEMVDATLDGSLQSPCLVVAIYEYHYLASSHDGSHAHGERQFGHLVDVVVEEA